MSTFLAALLVIGGVVAIAWALSVGPWGSRRGGWRGDPDRRGRGSPGRRRVRRVRFEESFDLTSPASTAGPVSFDFALDRDTDGGSRLKGILGLILLVALIGVLFAALAMGLGHLAGKTFSRHFRGG